MNQSSNLSSGVELPQLKAIPPNEQQVLAQLNDIYTPDPIGLWPPSIATLVIVLTAVILLLSFAYYLYRRRLNNRYRSYALTELAEIRESGLATDSKFNQVNTLLKRCAISGSTDNSVKEIVIKIWGDRFYRFLFKTIKPYKHIPTEKVDSFIHDWANLHYAPEHAKTHSVELIQGYLDFAEHWIRTHDKKSFTTAITEFELNKVKST